jgi:hypothetical protein
MGTAETIILADAGTKALFGTNLIPFLTNGWLSPKKGSQSAASWNLSLMELVQGLIPGGESFGQSGSNGWTNDAAGVANAVMKNLRDNGMQSLATAIVVPVAFKFGRKIFRKPITAGNRLLKGTGVKI